jgi:ubiquinone/menaquinone biosynthesis C-methylase UbiE
MLNVASQMGEEALRYDRVARFYDAVAFFVEWFASKHRKEILHQAKGAILEVGVGTGKSFKDYPPGNHITAIDISREMLRRAEQKLRSYNGKIELHLEDVQSLSFKDETFDTIFACWVFCSVDDPVKGLKEMHRVLKRNGKLLMIEHVKSKNKVLGYLMEKLNPLVARRDNINRDTVENLQKTGWTVKQEKNLAYDIVKAIDALK